MSKWHTKKPEPLRLPRDPRVFTAELVAKIRAEIRFTEMWAANVRWFAKTGRHTRSLLLVIPETKIPGDMLAICERERRLHLELGDKDRPCGCAWCKWNYGRASIVRASAAAKLKERPPIVIDTSRTCWACGCRAVEGGVCGVCGTRKDRKGVK